MPGFYNTNPQAFQILDPAAVGELADGPRKIYELRQKRDAQRRAEAMQLMQVLPEVAQYAQKQKALDLAAQTFDTQFSGKEASFVAAMQAKDYAAASIIWGEIAGMGPGLHAASGNEDNAVRSQTFHQMISKRPELFQRYNAVMQQGSQPILSKANLGHTIVDPETGVLSYEDLDPKNQNNTTPMYSLADGMKLGADGPSSLSFAHFLVRSTASPADKERIARQYNMYYDPNEKKLYSPEKSKFLLRKQELLTASKVEEETQRLAIEVRRGLIPLVAEEKDDENRANLSLRAAEAERLLTIRGKSPEQAKAAVAYALGAEVRDVARMATIVETFQKIGDDGLPAPLSDEDVDRALEVQDRYRNSDLPVHMADMHERIALSYMGFHRIEDMKDGKVAPGKALMMPSSVEDIQSSRRMEEAGLTTPFQTAYNLEAGAAPLTGGIAQTSEEFAKSWVRRRYSTPEHQAAALRLFSLEKRYLDTTAMTPRGVVLTESALLSDVFKQTDGLQNIGADRSAARILSDNASMPAADAKIIGAGLLNGARRSRAAIGKQENITGRLGPALGIGLSGGVGSIPALPSLIREAIGKYDDNELYQASVNAGAALYAMDRSGSKAVRDRAKKNLAKSAIVLESYGISFEAKEDPKDVSAKERAKSEELINILREINELRTSGVDSMLLNEATLGGMGAAEQAVLLNAMHAGNFGGGAQMLNSLQRRSALPQLRPSQMIGQSSAASPYLDTEAAPGTKPGQTAEGGKLKSFEEDGRVMWRANR